MASRQKRLRLPEEAVKMRKCPGISFSDGVTGRRARIAGTGIDVWEMVATYKGLDEDVEKLRSAYHWLDDTQIRSALFYYTYYPDEIEKLIDQNEKISETQVLKRFPSIYHTGK